MVKTYKSEGVSIRVAWNITGTARIPVLQPGASDVFVLLIDNVLNVLAMLLYLIRIEDTRDSRSDAQNSQLPVLGVHPGSILPDLIAKRARLRIVKPVASGYRVQIWSHGQLIDQAWCQKSMRCVDRATSEGLVRYHFFP